MTEGIFRLVYHSETAITGPAEIVDAEIRRILDASRRNNARADVTGALMFNRGFFVQALEGERARVEATFERIQRSPLHRNLVVLQFDETPERGFARWSMAFVGASQSDAARFGHLATESGFRPGDFDGDGLYGLLHDRLLEDEKSLSQTA